MKKRRLDLRVYGRGLNMNSAEVESCLQAQAETIENLLTQLNQTDTAPLASALRAALQREETLKQQCGELLESIYLDVDDDKRMSYLAQSLDSQNRGLQDENARLKQELAVLQEQVGLLRRSSTSPKKQLHKTSPKKQALLEHLLEALATKDMYTAAYKWRDVDYVQLDAESPENNYENLREIVKLRDKQLATLERDLRTKTKEPTMALERLIREIQEKDAEIDLLKNSILNDCDPKDPSPEVRALKDRVYALQLTLERRELDIRELLGEYESLRKELREGHELQSTQQHELSVLKDLPQDFRIQDLIAEAEEAKALLRHREQEASRLLADLVEVQGDRDNLRLKLVQIQTTQDELNSRKTSFEKEAQILRLQTELKLLKSRSPYPDLKECLRRALLRTERSPGAIEQEMKDVLAVVDNELCQRVSEELASFSASLSSGVSTGRQSSRRLNESLNLSPDRSSDVPWNLQRSEHEARQSQSQVDQNKAEVVRMRSLYDEEHKAHQKCLKLLKDAHPSIAEYELMREDYFHGLQANLNRIIEQLTKRVEALVADIRSKNDELLQQEARYEADMKRLADRVKVECARYTEVGERLNQEVARHRETKDRLDAFEAKGSAYGVDEFKRLQGSLRESEMNVGSLQDRVQELQRNLVDKTRHVEELETEVVDLKEQAERIYASEQALYSKLLKSANPQTDILPKRGLEAARLEVQNLTEANLEHQSLLAKLEDEVSLLKGQLTDSKTELHSLGLKHHALIQDYTALKEAHSHEVTELKLKLLSIPEPSFEESNEARGARQAIAELEVELSQARRVAETSAVEAKRLRFEATQFDEAKDAYELKAKQQADSLKTLKLEVARLKRFEEQIDELNTDNEILRQEIEALRTDKAKLRRKFEDSETSRESARQATSEAEDLRNQLDFLKRTVRLT